jgi:cold shock CspA family protein
MPKGIIKRLMLDHGFGFIKTEPGEDLFFHHTALQGVDYRVDFNSLSYERR